MKIEGPGSYLLPPWARNPLMFPISGERTVTGGGTQNLWTYTVPAGRMAVVMGFNFNAFTTVVGAGGDKIDIEFRYTESGGSPIVAYRGVLPADTTARSISVCPGTQIFLEEADALQSRVVETGNTATYEVASGSLIMEFDP